MSDQKRISCREAVAQMWAYIDGELPSEQELDVHSHLGACKSCYPHYDFQKAFCTFLRTCSREKVPPELRRRIFLRLLAEEAATNSSNVSDHTD
jgi:anti-sigma factor (TIGR02949 family)